LTSNAWWSRTRGGFGQDKNEPPHGPVQKRNFGSFEQKAATTILGGEAEDQENQYGKHFVEDGKSTGGRKELLLALLISVGVKGKKKRKG